MQNQELKPAIVSESTKTASYSIRNGWIFSPRLDLIAFVAPLFLAVFLLAVYSFLGFSLVISQTPEWALAFFFLTADLPHVYSTLFRTYWDPTECAKHKTLFYFAPLAIFLVSLGIYLLSDANFWHLFAYFNIYHLIRQTYGWINWSARKGGETSRFDLHLNKVGVYFLSLFPILWLMSRGTQAFWFTRGDFPNLFPRSVGATAHVFYWAMQLTYIGRQIYFWKSGKGFNLPKQLIWFSASLVWYVPMVVFHEQGYYIIAVALQTLTHAIPYLFLTFRYGRMRWPEKTGFPGSFLTPKGILFCYLAFVGFAALQISTELLYEDKEISTLIKGVLIALAALPQLTHFFVDGFIWKPGKDKNLRANLDAFAEKKKESA